MEEILKSIKLRPGMSNLADELLNDIISDIYNDISEFINLEYGKEMPLGCINIVKELVVIKINKLGSEGISSESHEGTSQSFINGIPSEIKLKLRRYRKLP